MTFSAVIPQSGVVVDCERLVDVRFSDGSVVHDAPSSMLQPIVPFELDQGVLYRGWLGYVMEVWPPFQGLDHCYVPSLERALASLATIPSLYMHKALSQFDVDWLVELVMQCKMSSNNLLLQWSWRLFPTQVCRSCWLWFQQGPT